MFDSRQCTSNKDIKSQLTDDERLNKSMQPLTDGLMDIGIERLEEVAGGGAVPHDPYDVVPHDPY